MDRRGQASGMKDGYRRGSLSRRAATRRIVDRQSTRRRSLRRDHAAKIQCRGGDLLPDARLLAGREPGGIDAGLRDRDHRVEVGAERASEGSVLIAQVGLDEGRIIRVEGQVQAGCGHPRPGMVFQSCNAIGDPNVRQRAHRDRDAAVDEQLSDRGVVDDRNPVVDPLDAQNFDVVADGRRWAVLPMVRGEMQPGCLARR